MPTAAVQPLLWASDAAVTAVSVQAQYPLWQAAVITPSLAGSFQVMYEWLIVWRKHGH